MAIPKQIEDMEREADDMLNQMFGKNNNDSSLHAKDQDAGKAQREGSGLEGVGPQSGTGLEVDNDSGKEHVTEPGDTADMQSVQQNTDDVDWKAQFEALEHKHKVLEGKFNKETKVYPDQLNKLNADNQRLMQEIENLKLRLDTKPDVEINPEDYSDYGDEMKNLAAQVNTLLKRNADLEARLSNNEQRVTKASDFSDQQRYDYMVSKIKDAVPNLEQINTDQGFLDWLAVKNPYTGATRQASLQQAEANFDHERLIMIFTDYLNESGKSVQAKEQKQKKLEEQAQPRRKPGDAPTQEKIYTTSEIDKLYADISKGKYTDEEAAKIEDKIGKAYMSGRVRD